MSTDQIKQEEKLRGYIGIAQKAGKIIAGDNMVIEALKHKPVYLVIVATDISDRVYRELKELISTPAKLVKWQTKLNLGLYVGKSPRGSLAVLDPGFARVILSILSGDETV